MKKTLIAVAALAATGAFAQVSVYGRLDVGYAQTTNEATVAGVTTETKADGVNSHNSASSMWGIQGSEDLGGGMKAFFKLEQDVYPANGNTGSSGSNGGVPNASGFNRTSLVGVSGGFGAIAFGRDYTPLFSLIGSSDIHALSRLSTVQTAAAGGGSTLPNQIMYTSPNLSGFVVRASLVNTDTSTTVGAVTTDAKVKGHTLTGVYNNGPLMVGAGIGQQETTAGAAVTKVEGTAIVAGYDFGTFSLKGNYVTSEATAAGVSAESTEMNIGVVMPMGKVKLMAQFGTNDLESSAAATDADGNDFVIGAEYALSAKTALFAKTGTYNKLSGTVLGVDASQKSTSTAVGIRTVF